jgi:hypothetical protein
MGEKNGLVKTACLMNKDKDKRIKMNRLMFFLSSF